MEHLAPRYDGTLKPASTVYGHVPTMDCQCKPQEVSQMVPASVGRGGRHQGYKRRTFVKHNRVERQD